MTTEINGTILGIKFFHIVPGSYTFIEYFFQKFSFQGVGILMFVQQFYRWCNRHRWSIIADVKFTADNFIVSVLESMKIMSRRIFVKIRNGLNGILKCSGRGGELVHKT